VVTSALVVVTRSFRAVVEVLVVVVSILLTEPVAGADVLDSDTCPDPQATRVATNTVMLTLLLTLNPQ